jgi:hypothetical protein
MHAEQRRYRLGGGGAGHHHPISVFSAASATNCTMGRVPIAPAGLLDAPRDAVVKLRPFELPVPRSVGPLLAAANRCPLLSAQRNQLGHRPMSERTEVVGFASRRKARFGLMGFAAAVLIDQSSRFGTCDS